MLNLTNWSNVPRGSSITQISLVPYNRMEPPWIPPEVKVRVEPPPLVLKTLKRRQKKPNEFQHVEAYRAAFGSSTLTAKEIAQRMGYTALGIKHSLRKMERLGYIERLENKPRGSTRGRAEFQWRWKDG